MKKSLYAALAIVLFPVIAMAQCPVPTTVYASVTFTRNSLPVTSTYWYRGDDNSWGATAMTESTDGMYEYFQSSNSTNQFKIATSTDGWDYDYTYVQAGFNSTDVTDIGDYSHDNCYCWYDGGTYYILVYYPNTRINATNNPIICASTTLPEASTAPVLNGVFTIDGSDNTVKFSRGNLQYQASSNTWQFAAHQYDFIGAANTNIASDYSGWIDLFGWATNGNSGNGTHYQPYDNTSTADTYGNIVGGGGYLSWEHDWGSNIGSDWRTLTDPEWEYILDSRASGATVDGVENARFTFAKILTDGTGTDGIDYNICGLILFPDGYDQGTPAGVNWNTRGPYDPTSSVNTTYNNFLRATTCTTAGWAALEAAGCVFLPCAGYRDGTTVSNVGAEGFYWTTTSGIGSTAETLHIPSTNILWNYARHLGHSVRLVQVQ